MKITSIETFLVSIPFKEPLNWSFGRRPGTSPLLIRVETDAGITGWGEAIGPMSSEIIKFSIENEIRQLIYGEDPFDIERILKKCLASGFMWCPDLGVFITAGIEMALWDIMGKATGLPVCKLLGGMFRKEVEFAAYIFIDSPKKMAAKCKEFVTQGYRTMKLKIGLDPKQDVEIVKTVREAVGPDIEIRVDANQAWSPGTSIRMIQKLKPYDIQFVEQPVRRDDMMGMRRVRMAVDVPIAVNEGVYTPSDTISVIKQEAADVIVTDIHNPGGMLECKKVCSIAEAAGIPVVMHSGAELGVATAAMIHLIASTPNFIFANDTHYHHLTDDILVEPFEFKNGLVRVPEKPGLGVEIDETKLKQYSEARTFTPFMDKEEKPDWIPTTPRF